MGLKKIKITCDTASMMPIGDLEAFQGKLKSITEAEFEKLKSAILKYGFSFPVFVWRKSILDGHQRVQAVKRLIDDGYELENGMLPVALIKAKDRKEAAEKLLLINSRYAMIEQDGFDWFVEDFDIDVVDMSNFLEIPEIILEFNDSEFNPENEWNGMPEFENENIEYFHSIKVNFDTKEDMDNFANMIDQTISDKTKFINYPKKERENIKQYGYESES